eukprot:9493465-Ditylum_brightwellii.AAC.1
MCSGKKKLEDKYNLSYLPYQNLVSSICNAALKCGTKLHIHGKGQFQCYRYRQYKEDKLKSGSHGVKPPNPMFQKDN